jgi:hypothetical protein
MSTSSAITKELDRAYAIEELQAHVPVESVLLEIYNRATRRTNTDDAFAYTIGVMETACIGLDLEFDTATAASTLENATPRSHPPQKQNEKER